MATECDTTGVIVKTSKNSCVVSLTVDGTTKSYPFSKTLFYSFGQKCEDDMTNLLEEDMEVEVSYRICPGATPTILAVWLGDKPVVPANEDLTPIYDRKGIVKEAIANDYVAHSDDGKVLVDKRVVFRDGDLCPTIAEDEEIIFDAVPIHDEHVSGALYDATCAWIGSRPRLVDRFCLQFQEPEADFSAVVRGTVGVIPNETIALVDVEVEETFIRVLLFRSSFQSPCERIQDAVDIGDKLCMRVRYSYVFTGRKQWFAQLAAKEGDEVDLMLEPENVIDSVTCDSDTESTAAPPCDMRPPCDKRPPIKTETEPSPKVREIYDKKCKFLYSDPPLSGVISKFSSKYGHIQYGNLSILVDPSNFYAERGYSRRALFDSYVASGENIVNFEAVLLNREDSQFSIFSHEATCAWVGKKPALPAVAASLPPPNFDLLDETDQVFYGIVSKLCFPSVALVKIPELSTTVCIHVHSFASKPRQYKGRWIIADFVAVGDCVRFKVERLPMLPKLLCSREVERENSKKIAESVAAGLLSRKPGTATNEKKPKEVNPVPQTVPSKPSTNVKKPAEVAQPAPQTVSSKSTTSSSTSSLEPDVCVASAFKNGCLSQNRAFLINCSGIIKTDENTKSSFVTVVHVFGSYKLSDKILYIREGKSLSVQSIASLSGRQVRFDAEKAMSANSNSNFVVTRMWDVNDTRPPSEVLLYSDVKLLESRSTRCCPAKVTSIPLHDAAIATVNNVPVLVPFESLVSLQEVNHACSSIDTLLSVGDYIGVRFERRKFPGELGGAYFRAVSSWCLKKGGEEISYDDEIRTCTPRVNSWFSKWGYGAFSCTANVVSLDKKYYVHHYSPRLGLNLNLDIFEKGKVFVDGNLVEPNKFGSRGGKQITYHVGHEYVDQVADDKSREMFHPKSMFVAWSWRGQEPSAEVMLKDALAVPKGSVCSNWCYEVVVESFPLPTHAMGRLGYAPVLIPLPQLIQKEDNKETFVGVKNVNLKRGDRVVVRILEEIVGNTTILVSNESILKGVSECDYHDVLKNVSGKIEKLPNPTGLIKAFNSGVTVSFELCHFRRFKKGSGSDMKWFENLNESIKIGKKVYFSAVKVNAKTAPYRAFEVYFD